jgi:rSAM/selenodomain-associated transferase 2
METASPILPQKISVIIPTLNEESRIVKLLRSLQAIAGLEVIVVDGLSQDKTAEMAEGLASRVLTAPRGRALQMNEGAKYATGDIFLFLHADTSLEPAAFDQLTSALADPTIVGGAFSFCLGSPKWGLRLIAAATNFRSRIFFLPYGDQAIFVKRRVFEEIGGYAELPLMEDLDLVRRLKRRGRLVILPARAVTSARRWKREGILYTTARNWTVTVLFLLGVSPSTLARWYPPVR